MGQILCSDLFNIYTSFVSYKERPKLLHINKQIHSLYTKYFLTKDKKTFSSLKNILVNEDFFNILLGDNHQPFIKNLNDDDINTIHEYSYKKRNITTVEMYGDEYRYLVCPIRLAGYIHKTHNHYRNNILSILIFDCDDSILNDFTYIKYHQKHIYNFNGVYGNQTFFKDNNTFVQDFKKYDPKKYKLQFINSGGGS
jgi:hypothetical protein